MNIHVHIDATRFRSHAEMIQEAKDRHKRFELAARRAVMKIATPEPEPEKERFMLTAMPLWEQFGLNFDAHVVEWYLRKANPALTYIKDRCLELGWSPVTILGQQRRRDVVGIRQLLMWEVSERFRLSLPQIGRMFGGRDHTTVLHAIRRVEAKTERASS